MDERTITNDRLNRLADEIEASQVFSQAWHTTCAVGFARKMYEKEGNKSKGMSYEDKGLADYFGLSLAELDALYLANYEDLNIGLKNVPNSEFRYVSRQTVADVLRRLARRG